MSNSNLVNYTKLSPNYSSREGNTIKKITIHHMAGNLTVETCGAVFAKTSAGASANYGVGTDGRVGLYVEEKNRAWTSSSASNDCQAVTIEVANDGGASTNWHVSDKALAKTIDLCVDICKRNGIKKLNFTGNANGNLTMHCYFAATACPGPYLKSKFQYIADIVNKRLSTPSVKPTTTSNTIQGWEVQSGAFKTKANADNLNARLKKAGYNTCVRESGGLYKVMSGGPYDNFVSANARVSTLKRSGFDATVVKCTTTTSAVEAANAPAKPKVSKKSATQLAKEIIRGDYGNGDARVKKLKSLGYTDAEINAAQAQVNKML